MSEINLLELTPHQVSRDMRGYSVLFYGEGKSGKTTVATKFPRHLLIAFEKGYSAIPGAMAQPVNSWSEFKKILKQLKSPEVQTKYETVILDTVDIAWDYAEKYICAINNVDSISDIPWGKGFKALDKEFDEALRAIVQLDYGLVLISHSQDKTFTDESGKEYNRIVPTLDKRPYNLAYRLCDIVGYARPMQDEKGEVATKLFLRGTPRFVAGSRFKYTPGVIDFTYDNLVSAITSAIDMEMAEVGSDLFTEEKENIYQDDTKKVNYDLLMDTFHQILDDLKNNYTEEEFKGYWAPRIVQISNQHLGAGKKIADLTRDQVEILDVIIDDLIELVGEGSPS